VTVCGGGRTLTELGALESFVDGSPATLYDVAKRAGVSTATVSRVVHDHELVRESTRVRVLAAIEELGYVPDGAAQSLSRRRKEVIGLVSLESRSPDSDIEQTSLLFVEEVLRGAEAALRDVGWSLLISFLRAADGAYDKLRSMSGKVDGLLITEGILSPRQLTSLVHRLPVVVVAGSQDERNVDVVDADNRAGMRALVAHLVKVHSLKKMFYVAGPADAPDAQVRRLAFEEELARHGGARIVGEFEGRFSAVSGQAAAQVILSDRQRLPQAVVCANDQMAIGAIRELARGGVRVPEDIAVVGFDDIYPGALLHPSLTTVHQPMRLLGERACSRLLDRIADPTLPQQVELLPTELILRESCGCGRDDKAGGRRTAATRTRARKVSA
jgi:LacI family transcriptional regulator